MKRIAIFPGSFDPITLGHRNLINNSLHMFDKIIIAVGINDNKDYMFSLDQRIAFIETVFKANNNVIVKSYSKLTINLCMEHNAKYIIRGLRNNLDFNYEIDIAFANQALNNNIQTIFLPTLKEDIHISSSKVREIIKFKGNLKKFLPPEILNNLDLLKIL